MIININEPISKDTFDKIIHNYNLLNENELLEIYFSSEGGDVDYMECIIDFINKNSSKIRLYAYGEICSAGFEIFFKSTCYREVLPGTMGMTHFAEVTLSLNGGSSKKVGDKAYLNWVKEMNKACITYYTNLGFTKKEIAKINKGEDVWFQVDRLKEFLSKSITIYAEYK